MTIAQRVAAGAVFMDLSTPGWHLAVDPDRLDLGSACNCIFGQQFGHFAGGLRVYALTRQQAVDLGFLTEVAYRRKSGMTPAEWVAYNLRYEAESDALTAAWSDEIETRRRLGDEVVGTAEELERWEAMPL
jgi:hypothetical protein